MNRSIDIWGEPEPDREECFFHAFPTLPRDVRLKIWKLSAPEDRIVTIKDASTWMRLRGKTEIFWYYRVRATYTVPAIFQVNKESRQAALQIYHLTLTSRIGHPVPFNFLLDTLLFDGPDGASTLNTFVDSNNSVDKVAVKNEIQLMHANLQTLIVAGDHLYVYTSEDVEGFYNLRLCLLPWTHDHYDRQLLNYLRAVWDIKLGNAKAELTKKVAVREMEVLAAAYLARVKLEARIEYMDNVERKKILAEANSKVQDLIVKLGLELKGLRGGKTEVMFTNGLGVEAWLGEGVEITKAPTSIIPPLNR